MKLYFATFITEDNEEQFRKLACKYGLEFVTAYTEEPDSICYSGHRDGGVGQASVVTKSKAKRDAVIRGVKSSALTYALEFRRHQILASKE